MVELSGFTVGAEQYVVTLSCHHAETVSSLALIHSLLIHGFTEGFSPSRAARTVSRRTQESYRKISVVCVRAVNSVIYYTERAFLVRESLPALRYNVGVGYLQHLASENSLTDVFAVFERRRDEQLESHLVFRR